MNTDQLIQWIGANPYPAIAAGLILLALAAFALRRGKHSRVKAPVAVITAAIAAAACTAYSADTSWRFAADHLGMTSTIERAAMFGAAELALFSMALMARQNLRTQDVPGLPGVLVWVITGVQVIPAFAESGIVGGTVRAFVGPVLAAMLWHLAMGIELRHAKPGANSQSLPAVLARELRERLLSRLGLAIRDRSAEQITRDRWTIRAVALAARLSEFTPDRRAGWRGRFLGHRLSVAVGRAQAGADVEQRQMLLQLLAARRHATGLATIVLPSPWEADVPVLSPLSAADATSGRDASSLSGRGADTQPQMLSAPARKALSAPPDIGSEARADKGADTPLNSQDMGRTRTPRTRADSPVGTEADKALANTSAPSVAALVRTALDGGIDDPDTVLEVVREVHPDADKASVKRTLRREREKRTTYM